MEVKVILAFFASLGLMLTAISGIFTESDRNNALFRSRRINLTFLENIYNRHVSR